jgi:hypothetical protein
MRTVKCRFCPEQIGFVKNARSGKLMPVEAGLKYFDPAQDAGVMVVTTEGEVGRMGTKFREDVEGYEPHWSKCPGKEEARRERV